MKLNHAPWMAVVLVTLWAAPAFAHPGHAVPGNGMIAGLLHPFLGWDHLLAMVTVGLMSAQLGGRACWTVPGTFVGSMIAGGIAGMLGWEMPAIEFGIAMSVLLLGLAVALDRRFSLAIPLTIAGVFGFVHGQAHGVEMPFIDSPSLYAAGFVLATVGLHITGVLVGRVARHSTQGVSALRLSGAVIALAGGWLILSV